MGGTKELEQALGAAPDEAESGLTDLDDTVAEARRSGPIQRVDRKALARGTPLGRYLVVDKLARGGMGVVYVAYDPELHRRVAIKLLLAELTRAEDATAGRARLLREAQAIARLSHPNVIHVYDVGTFEDAVFLALEFIDGENLAKWLKREARPWREVVRVFVAAGRGLAAAHAAGIVHRDFKPENVLIGRDGRVLVTDFGLARDVGNDVADPDAVFPSPDEPAARGSQPSIPTTPLSMPLTKLGTIMGTPGYVAPEHLKGALADQSSDQFSFAASLYAGLYHKRPYAAKSFKEYRELLEGGLPEPPANGVPAWVRRTVERGLSNDPAGRFASMDAFLDELSRDPAARRRRVLLGVAGAGVLAAAVGVTLVASGQRDEAVCTGAGAKLAGVWDPARKEQVRAAFLATERPYAQAAFDTIARRLDERGRAWTAMRTDVCEATRRRREQPESVMVLGIACLDRRLRETGQLVDVFAAADGTVVERAVGATSALSSLDDCVDVARLTAAVEPPKDAATRAKADTLRIAIGMAKILTDAGKYKDARAIAAQAADDARALGHRPIVAESLVQLGELESYVGNREAATASLRQAIRLADASRDDAVRARAYAWLTGVVGYDLENTAEGLALAEDTRATLARLGSDPRLEATLESNLGRIYSVLGDYEKMYRHHDKALEIRRRIYGEDDPNTANSQNNVAAALHDLGRITEALAGHEKTLAMRRRALGEDHPWVAMSWSNIGNQYYELGRLDEGIEVTDRALAIGRRAVPANSALVLIALGNRAAMLGEVGRFDDARVAFDELISTLRADQPTSMRLARALANASTRLLTASGRPREGLAAAEEALALIPADVRNDVMAMSLIAKGEALEALGKLDEAVVALRAGLVIYEATVGRETPTVIDPLTAIARIALARGKPAEAATLLTRVLAVCEKTGLGGKWLARTQFELARALAAADRPRAVALAEQARTWYATVPTLARDLAGIDTWLATNR